jgi:16S rRNA (adenine1518-N6/adenine1519-N6)-dimethyltransferase
LNSEFATLEDAPNKVKEHSTKHSQSGDYAKIGSVPKVRRPKLGQHFLRGTHYVGRIAKALEILPEDLVIEVGPGRGAMTEHLAARARQLVAIEIDPVLARGLREKFGDDLRIEIVTADFLSVNLRALCQEHGREQCWVFGNLPYYITSPIIHHLLDFALSIRGMALLVQREVAERLTAAPGSRAYGYLSVLAQLHSYPRIALAVPPGAFSPPPEVHSALVDFRMTPRFPQFPSSQRNEFLTFVKACFAQKRKNLLNNLAGIYTRQRVQRALENLNLPLRARAEEFPLEHFAALFKAVTSDE